MSPEERQIIEGVIVAFDKAREVGFCDEQKWDFFCTAGHVQPLKDLIENIDRVA